MIRTLCHSSLLIPILLLSRCSSQDGAGPSLDEGIDAAIADAMTDANRDAPAAFIDTRDSRAYPTVAIGGQTWLARNLNYAIDGSSFCYDDLDTNCEEYGRLYTWNAAQTACPPGSHLGTDEEWKALEGALGMPLDQVDLEGYSTVRGTDEGMQLKASDGFAALMAGFRSGVTYEAIEDRTYLWTATTRGNDVWRRRITAADPTVFRFTNPPADFAISVRCILN